MPPTLTSMLYGKPVHCHMYIERIPVEQIPEGEAESAKWLHDLFVVKVRERYIEAAHFLNRFYTEIKITK